MLGKIVPDIVENQKIYSVSPTASAREIAGIMTNAKIGAVVVLDAGALVGIVTERDLTVKVLAEARDADAATAADIMTVNPDTLGPDDSPMSALELMRVRKYRHLPVVDDGEVVAMVSVRDLYNAVHSQLEEDVRQREAFIFGTGYGAGA